MLILAPSLARSNNYPLGNYVYEFFDDCFAFDGAGTVLSGIDIVLHLRDHHCCR
jgi:hypothetical protein